MNNNDINVNARLEREFLGHNLFDQVEDNTQKSWNRLMTFMNLYVLKGRQNAKDYLKLIPKDEKDAVLEMYQELIAIGYKKLHKKVWDHINA